MRPVALVSALLLLFASCAHDDVRGPARDDGWQLLCDGDSLDGWVTRGGAGTFTASKSEIRGVIAAGTPSTFLCTTRQFGDFVLELEARIKTPANSGIQIRSHAREPDGRVFGYQVELDPSDRAWTAGIYDEGRRGWLQSLEGNAAARKAFRRGGWNHLRIVAKGSRIRTWLNGVPAADLTDDADSSGFIALQLHGHRQADPQVVLWRNIRIKRAVTF